MTIYTITAARVDLIPADLLVPVLGLDLDRLSHDSGADASHTETYLDAAGQSWDLPVYGLVVGTRILMWSRTDEAGVADVTVQDVTEATDDVQDYAVALATKLDAWRESESL